MANIKIMENPRGFRMLVAYPKTATFLYSNVIDQRHYRCGADHGSLFTCVLEDGRPRLTLHRVDEQALEGLPKHEMVVIEENENETLAKYFDVPFEHGAEQGTPNPNHCLRLELLETSINCASIVGGDRAVRSCESLGGGEDEAPRSCAAWRRWRKSIGIKVDSIKARPLSL